MLYSWDKNNVYDCGADNVRREESNAIKGQQSAYSDLEWTTAEMKKVILLV